MKELIRILKSNGTGVLEGNFYLDLEFDSEIINISKEEYPDTKLTIKFSLGRKYLGRLSITLDKLANSTTGELNIDSEKNKWWFSVDQQAPTFILYFEDLGGCRFFGRFIVCNS